MTYRYHGKYCGPGWSENKYQLSVVGVEEPIDELDKCCRDHDAAYAMGHDLAQADRDFVLCAYKHDIVAATVVGLQYIFRSAIGINMVSKPKLKGNAQQKQKQNPVSDVTITAPASIGHVLQSIPTKTKSIKDGVLVSGREFVETVEGNGVSTFGLGKSAFIAPAYFQGGVLAQISRSYQKYRFKRIMIHYVPKVSTNTTGAVVLCSQENVTMPCLAAESSSFLQRAIVSGSGILTPIWSPATLIIKTDNKFRYVDPLANNDINENVFCELQVYSQIGSSAQPGYLWMEYECELVKPMLEPHSTLLPILTGPGLRVTFQDTSATPTAGSFVQWNETTSSLAGLSYPIGTVLRFVFDLRGSSVGTGSSGFSTMFKTANNVYTTSASVATQFVNDPFIGGTVLYLLVFNSNIYYVFATLDGALSGASTGQNAYRDTITTKGTYVGDAQLVHLAPSDINSVQ